MKKTYAYLLALLLIILIVPARADFFFADIFLAEGEPPLLTDSSYISQNIAITITSQRYMNSDVYIADIYIRDLMSFQRGFANGNWSSGTAELPRIAEDNGAILAMTGDYAHYFQGWLMGNGHLLRATRNPERDLCLIYQNGEMRTIRAQEINHAWLTDETPQLWHIFCFGPTLLDADGHACTIFNTEVESDNPRSAIGYYEPGHYCFVQVDGRGTKSAVQEGEYNIGLNMHNLARLMESLGCQVAYNLDGGQSSMLWFNGQIISTPYLGGRPIGDIVLIREPYAASEH